MKSRRNGCNKAEKQMFEAKNVKKSIYSSLETGCDLCLQRLSYKSTEKQLESEAKKPKYIFENKYFQKIKEI